MPHGAKKVDDIPGGNMAGAETWRILPTKTPFSPGVIVRSTTGMRKARRLAHFRWVPVHLGSKTWPATCGSGVTIITRHIAVCPKLIRGVRLVAPSAFIGVGAGNPGST